MRPPVVDLLALPCAGASAAMYSRWRRFLPEEIRLVPVELPGRGSRLDQRYVEDFDLLIEKICLEHSQSLQGRYALFGHSMGALLAYGMARRQRSLDRVMPCAVFVSASPAPSRRDPGRFADTGDDALVADLRRQGGTPEEVFQSDELLRITLDTLGADYRVCDSFSYAEKEPLAVPLHVLAGRQDDISAERMQAWQRESVGAFTIDWFDGGHFFIRQHEQQTLAVVLRELSRAMSR